MNLPFTLPPDQAADAVRQFKPKAVYPYHYRGSDTAKLKKLVGDASAIGMGNERRLVEVEKNLARFRAAAWPDKSAILKFIHDARGARVAQAQSALHEGDAGFLLHPNDLNALLDNFLILIDAATSIGCGAGAF